MIALSIGHLGAALALAANVPATRPISDDLTIGRMRPAFDHLGGQTEQLDAAVAGRCTMVYATGIGAYSYHGLPPKATMDGYLEKLKEYNRGAHAGGVRIMLSYLCATSIVNIEKFAVNWDDYFPDRPADFTPQRMLQQDINGRNLPSWYGGDYSPADMWNPYWRQYTRLMMKLAAESGHDGVFFDNPTVHMSGNYSPHAMRAWARFLEREGVQAAADDIDGLRALTKTQPQLWRRFRVTEAADFLRELHEYCHTLKPGFLLTVNNSLNSWDSFYSQPRGYAYGIPEQSRHEDFITIEDMSSQPRRQGEGYVSYASTLRLIHAIGNGRPLAICTTDGDYIAPVNLMALSIAECTAHDAAYMVWSCWEPAFRDSLAASVARYHNFLEAHAGLFSNSQSVADVLLIWPYENWLNRDVCLTAQLARELSAHNVQYEVITEADLTVQRLKGYPAVAFAAEEGFVRKVTPDTLRAYEEQGGAVMPVSSVASRAGGITFNLDPLKKTMGSASVALQGPLGVRAVARRTQDGEYLLHLYNLNVMRTDKYHDAVTPAENVRVSWLLPVGAPDMNRVNFLTANPQGTSGRQECTSSTLNGRTRLDFVVPKLWVWTVVSPR